MLGGRLKGQQQQQEYRKTFTNHPHPPGGSWV
jgi:hypothetical protein